jgi:ornithine cyclodeaminase/alanine dehydrogenase-like protein (mu-crystallin family)
MSGPGIPPLRYLTAGDVTAAMPPLDDRLRLAEQAMVGLVEGGELPPKIGVHPRPASSFAHAMPALLRGADASGSADLLGMKWIAGFPANRAAGLPAIHGLLILNDPRTGVPAAILDAGSVTAERTAAISGVAIRRFAPEAGGRPVRIAVLGAGVQGRSHVAVLGQVLPGASITVFDRHPERADALGTLARGTRGVGAATTASTARAATQDADVVVTAASFTSPSARQVLTNDWLAPDALVVAVDYATYVHADVARTAALFVVDQREQFLANRDAGQFDGYPEPALTLGDAILAGTGRPTTGRVLVSHLGVGLADIVFGNAIVERAATLGLGTLLTR